MAVATWILSGTGDSSTGRVAISGRLKDSTANGRVRFTPAPGNSGPASSGQITNGAFKLSDKFGPGPGKYNAVVLIGDAPTATRLKLGRNDNPDDIPQPPDKLSVSKDNHEFSLTINEGGKNAFIFDLNTGTVSPDQ